MMIDRVDGRLVDLVLFAIANLVNLLMVGLFLVRPRGLTRVEFVLGLVVVAMILPVGVAVILNILEKRAWWTIVLPLPLILFFVMELIFDYIVQLDFRNTALLWPYITIYYLGLMGMIGYSFTLGKSYGWVTLVTYFLNLAVTWYATVIKGGEVLL